jgi:hypothetical protein
MDFIAVGICKINCSSSSVSPGRDDIAAVLIEDKKLAKVNNYLFPDV